MKRILVFVILSLFFTCGFACAKSGKTDMPYLKMNGTKFYLYYSAKSTETGGYINEYYKTGQTYTSWNELIGIHHYPTAFYPIEHAKEFSDFLGNSGVEAPLEVYDEDNKAIMYFVIVNNNRLPIIMEFNVFKFVKSPVCGTVALQYARRYLLTNNLEVDKIKKDFVKSAIKYIKQADKLEIPDIVTIEIDNGIYQTTKKEQQEEKVPEQAQEPESQASEVKTPETNESETAEQKTEEPAVNEEQIKEPEGKEEKVKEPKVKKEKVKEPKVKEEKVKPEKVKEPKVKEEKVKTEKIKEPKVKEEKIETEKVKEPKVKKEKVKTEKVKEPKVKAKKAKKTPSHAQMPKEVIEQYR